MNALDFTAAQILAIPLNEPERVFNRDSMELHSMFRKLASKWHPDRCKDAQAQEVLQHVVNLRRRGDEKIADNTWQEPGFFQCELWDGKTFRVPADVTRRFEIGEYCVSPTTVTYVVDEPNKDLWAGAMTDLTRIEFPDQRMRDTYFTSLPTTINSYHCRDDRRILTVKKRPDDILLRDLIPHIPADKRGKHACWITSRLHEIVRYLDHIGLNHNSITADTVFVSPSQHRIGLFGGWWYSSPFGIKPQALPGIALPYRRDLWVGEIDRAMIRSLALEIFGGPDMQVMQRVTVPAIIEYLKTPSSGDAQSDLRNWYTVLEKSYGQRRFTELSVTYSDVYKQGVS